jgi:hypothetical protein
VGSIWFIAGEACAISRPGIRFSEPCIARLRDLDNNVLALMSEVPRT